MFSWRRLTVLGTSRRPPADRTPGVGECAGLLPRRRVTSRQLSNAVRRLSSPVDVGPSRRSARGEHLAGHGVEDPISCRPRVGRRLRDELCSCCFRQWWLLSPSGWSLPTSSATESVCHSFAPPFPEVARSDRAAAVDGVAFYFADPRTVGRTGRPHPYDGLSRAHHQRKPPNRSRSRSRPRLASEGAALPPRPPAGSTTCRTGWPIGPTRWPG